MSVVANVVSPSASWIVYDGRAMRNGEIVSEDVTKAKMVNKFVCVGYTGCLEVAEKVLEVLESPENAPITAVLLSDDMARNLLMILQRSIIPENLYAQFLITGINSAGKMATYAIDRSQTLHTYIPSAVGQFKISVLSTGKSQLDLTSYVFREINRHGTNKKTIISAMKKYICDVADEDSTVNKNLSVIEVLA